MKSKPVILLFIILFCLAIFYSGAASQDSSSTPVIESGLAAALAQLQSGQKISVIVTLRDKVDLQAISTANRRSTLAGFQTNLIQSLQRNSDRSQADLRLYLSAQQQLGKVDSFTPLWIVNAIAVTAGRETITALAAFPGVQSITADGTIEAPPAPADLSAPLAPAHNLTVINAPAVWALGLSGQGVVITSLDTGVDVSHTDLNSRWRGGNNSWFDPYGQRPTTPTDVHGHGTWTMGVMVGGSGSGTDIGVAPQAQWIAAKIFNDSGSATISGIHMAYQWVLDPDGSPGTPDAPEVVNNSWTSSIPGCDLTFQPDLQALVAAGIIPVFAAVNNGPAASSSRSPANLPEAFSVGATDNNDAIYTNSSRGPNSCAPRLSLTRISLHQACRL